MKGDHIMIDFDEEIRQFKPSMEIEEMEDLILDDNLTDLTDLMMEILKGKPEEPGKVKKK